MPANVIAVKGTKRVTGASSNHGNDNIITDGSVIAVADGQCMIIVEQGKVVEICAQPGEYKYDNASEPSLFVGKLGDSVKSVFAQIGKRFTFGGQPAEDQRVYYFNTKELTGNKYGTPNAVPFRVVDKNIGLDMDISVRCFGEYSYKVTNPILFYTNVTGNFADSYTTDMIDSQLKTELLTALQPAFAKISEMGIRYSALPGHATELADALNEQLSAKWKDLRGIEIVSFGVSSITANEEDEKAIKQAQQAAINRDPGMAAATLVNAQAQAMQNAASNPNGSMMGFMGMNAAQGAGGANANAFFQASQAQQAAAAPAAGEWICPKCGAKNNGKFCSQCGTPKPETGTWTCPKCGAQNTGKFCSQCGTAKPE
jgi:membrane protease subunit (stomatin/prohibitin family)